MLHRFKVVLLVLCFAALGAATAAASSVTFTQVPLVPNTGGVYGTTLYTGLNINASGQTTGYCTAKLSSRTQDMRMPGSPTARQRPTSSSPTASTATAASTATQATVTALISAGTVAGYCNSTTLSAGAQAFVMSGGWMTVFDTGWETGQTTPRHQLQRHDHRRRSGGRHIPPHDLHL